MTTPVHTLTASDRCPAHLQQLSKDLLQMKVRITVGRGKMEMMALDELHKDNEKKRKDASDKKRAMRTKTGETPAPLPLPALDTSSHDAVPTPALVLPTPPAPRDAVAALSPAGNARPWLGLEAELNKIAEEEEEDNKEHDQ